MPTPQRSQLEARLFTPLEPGSCGAFSGYRSFQGLCIASEGRLGWFYGSDLWPAGEFFRYQITDLQPVTGSARQPGR
jgi:hypothetical protein